MKTMVEHLERHPYTVAWLVGMVALMCMLGAAGVLR